MDNILEAQHQEKHLRPQHEILEELVTGVRGLNARMRDFDSENLERERYLKRRKMRLHPRMLVELSFMSHESGDSLLALLLMAGHLREDFPWLAELFVESYREIRDGGPEIAETVLHRLQRSVKSLYRSGMTREMVDGSKDAIILLEELPVLLDKTLHYLVERTQAMPPERDEIDESQDRP